jgi:hypothetical protein
MEKKTFIDLIGNTPLVHLRRASEDTGCTILGKAEFLNPGQSVKDRAALFIIEDAERKGLLRPGGTIVEGTADRSESRPGDALPDLPQRAYGGAEDCSAIGRFPAP